MHRLIFIIFLLSSLGGCTTPTKYYYPPPDSTLRNELGNIYLDVVPFTYSGHFEEPIKGKGKGALAGAFLGAGTPLAGALLSSCYYKDCLFQYALGIALAPVGAVVGVVYGAAATSSEEDVNAALGRFANAVNNYEYAEVLKTDILQQANLNTGNYVINPIEDRSSGISLNSTVLELRISKMSWISEGKLNPDLYLALEIEANVITDKNVYSTYYRKWSYSSFSKNMYELLDNDAEKLKNEITGAISIVSKSIVDDLFLNTETEIENLKPKRGIVYTIKSSNEQIK